MPEERTPSIIREGGYQGSRDPGQPTHLMQQQLRPAQQSTNGGQGGPSSNGGQRRSRVRNYALVMLLWRADAYLRRVGRDYSGHRRRGYAGARTTVGHGQGASVRPPKPIKGVGRHADRYWCPTCGLRLKDCTCG